MNTSTTDKLALPFLQPGQALKTITHNEALQRLDAGLYLSCSDMSAEEIPPEPTEGYVLILSAAFAGAASEQAGDIGVFKNGNWYWFTPTAGWAVWDEAAQTLRIFNGQDWALPSTSALAETLPQLGVNSEASVNQRLVVASGTSLFTHDGDSHRMAVNRATETETASLIFQTNYAGEAEIGLTGQDGFSLKTSPDGANWSERFSTPQDFPGVRAPAFGSLKLFMDSDSAKFIPTPATGGMLALTVTSETGLARPEWSGILAYSTGTTPRLESLVLTARIVNHGSTVLDGTVSPQWRIGISAVEGGIYIENRRSEASQLSLTFLC